MKILHILHDSFPILSGYAVRSANIARFQAALGLTPMIVTSPRHESCNGKLVEEIDDLLYYRTPVRQKWQVPFLSEIAIVRTMENRIAEITREVKPDILHAHSPCLWGEAAARVARKTKLPLVYEIRGFWEDAAVDLGKIGPQSPRYRLTRALESRVCRAAQAVVTIAENLKDDLVKRGIDSETISLVPNGVDTDSFKPIQKDQELSARLDVKVCTCIGYVGTLHPWEGVVDFVRAAPMILAASPRVKMFIAGAGSESSAIRTLIENLNLSGQVIFLGKVPHDEIRQYYSIMDILVYPRRSTRNTECVTPLKPLEAMAMEKAVICSDVGGLRELVPAGIGLSFRAGDCEGLAQACLELLNDPGMREQLGRAARSHVVEKRNWQSLAAHYLDIYADALAGDSN